MLFVLVSPPHCSPRWLKYSPPVGMSNAWQYTADEDTRGLRHMHFHNLEHFCMCVFFSPTCTVIKSHLTAEITKKTNLIFSWDKVISRLMVLLQRMDRPWEECMHSDHVCI